MIAIPRFTPGQLIQLLGLSSVAIGFAFRVILKNYLAGILILLTEPFRIDDQDEWAMTPEVLMPLTAADAALSALQPLLRSLTPEDQPKPTPCTGLSCHDMAERLFMSLTQVGAMAGATIENPQEGSLENRVSVMAAQAIDAWRDVDLAGTVPGPGGAKLPASFAAAILPLELLLHGWDLAQGSGKPIRVSDELVDYVRSIAAGVVEAGRRPGGSFAAEVTPAEDATALDRFAAFAGRRPVAA